MKLEILKIFNIGERAGHKQPTRPDHPIQTRVDMSADSEI
ncbi:hypothetical protein HMPREF0043_01142 [Actinobaculum sp. oral taxon 183 str. F0552]|nr:hypothetical protein HMPREF0043_01142 [Actinobaculum sp. oral taxon 183 str. F0552]